MPLHSSQMWARNWEKKEELRVRNLVLPYYATVTVHIVYPSANPILVPVTGNHAL